MPKQQLDERLSSLSGRDLCLVTLYGEARGEPVEGQVAVMHVIQNRVRDGRWGESIHDVLGAWAQFSALWPTLSGGLNYQSVLDYATVLHTGARLPFGQGQLQRQLEWVVDGVLNDSLIDNTFLSTHYFYTFMEKKPYWATKPGVRMATIGRHEFWAGVK